MDRRGAGRAGPPPPRPGDQPLTHTPAPPAADFSWAFGLNRFSLKLMGIWPTGQRTRPLHSAARIPCMVLIMLFGLLLPQMYALALVIRQLPLVIDNLLTSSPTFTSCIKLLFIWRHSSVLGPVVESARRDWQRAKSPGELALMRRQAARARLVTKADYVVLGCCYAGFVASPFVDFDIRMINNLTDYGPRSLLVQSYYPYDYSRSPRFELTQCLQLLGSFFVGMAVSIPDDYFGALVLHASAQFEVLGQEVERFARHGDARRRLRLLVDRHVHLNRMVRLIEQAFGHVIAAQIFCMSTMVCCLGFQILGMLEESAAKPDTLQVVTLVGTLLTMMMHTLVDCFASESLASRSEELHSRIYSSQWYCSGLPPVEARHLIPMMVVSKTPRQLRAGKILFMSMATYCSIIKSTAGYISMLIAVSGRQMAKQ